MSQIDDLKIKVGPKFDEDFRVEYKGRDVTDVFNVKRLAFEFDVDKDDSWRYVTVQMDLFAEVELVGSADVKVVGKGASEAEACHHPNVVRMYICTECEEMAALRDDL